MSDQEREPDTTESGGGRDVGEGLPEEQPGGTSPAGGSPAGDGGDSPDKRDSEPDTATGNPGAAG